MISTMMWADRTPRIIIISIHFANIMSLGTMSIKARAAMFKVTRMGWPNLGIGMAKFGPIGATCPQAIIHVTLVN